jgi:hypothetical protein
VAEHCAMDDPAVSIKFDSDGFVGAVPVDSVKVL